MSYLIDAFVIIDDTERTDGRIEVVKLKMNNFGNIGWHVEF